MIYISHNLGLILETCDRITVMYSGEAVEVGPVSESSTRCAIPIRAACSTRFPLPGGRQERPAAGGDPRPVAACRTGAAGLLSSLRAATIRRTGRCDVAPISMERSGEPA